MSKPNGAPDFKGPIAWMSSNSVAANLLMIGIALAGLFLGLMQVKQEVFPEIDLDMIFVAVPYPGASPVEVEQGLVLAIEEAVRGIDGVKRVNSTSAENIGSVQVEVQLDANADKVLADVKNEVDRITSFPEDAEEPQVSLLKRGSAVVSLIVSGDQELHTLHTLAERMRAELMVHPDITLVDIQGVPDLEVAIEVSRENLERYDLTLDDIALRVRASSLELPAGGVDTRAGEILVKLNDRRRTGDEFASIVVKGGPAGSITLGDIATITDGYADVDMAHFYGGQRALRLVVYRVGNETPQKVSDATQAYLDKLRGELPASVQVSLWDDDSKLLRARIDLLVKNALQGLVLVLIVLALFMNLRLALWVALGIPISFLGAFALMPGFDISINMISLFAFIITLGMVVDDAIIIGENIYEKQQQGMERMQAAVEGARQMAMPVSFAILTTIAAFSPMFFVPGAMGKIFKILPGIVIAVLVFSLVESFFVLPAHLGHEGALGRMLWRNLDFLNWPSRQVAKGLAWFTRAIYQPVLKVALDLRYGVLAASLGLFIVALGVALSGTLPFSFMPKLEGNTVSASARLPYGVPLEVTEQVRRELEASAMQAIDNFEEKGILNGMYTRVGEGPAARGPGAGRAPTGSHLVTVELELVGSEQRDTSAEAVSQAWRALTPNLAGVESVDFNAEIGPNAGAAVDVQIAHRDLDVLIAASDEVDALLRGYADLTSINNSFSAGKPQIDYHLRESASTLGFTSSGMARQLRSFFYGAEALREQRGRNEVKVMVRLPEHQRASEYDLEALRVRAPGGGYVPLSDVADFERNQSPTEIKRESGQRVLNITARLADGARSNQAVILDLQNKVFPELLKKYPGLEVGLAGQQREQGEALGALGLYYLVALLVMYALLAIPFKSWFQPLLVMAAIPMGLVGAFGGHLMLGYNLSLISVMGIVALSGVVVNDSLVLIDAANQYRAEGNDARTAVIMGGTRRLRPIILTSLTTFFGLMPLIFETSVQARFMIPMAISLGFGVLFATGVILVMVPAAYLVLEDALALFRSFMTVALRDEAQILQIDDEVPTQSGVQGAS